VVFLGFFNKVMSKESVNLEDILNTLDEVQEETYEDADAFVKSFDLNSNADLENIVKEVKQGNIILANITDIMKRDKSKLKDFVDAIKKEVKAIDGDIARISAEKLMVTPSKVKIIKKRGQ
jgi:SepF-like predicted cell division protein (DUF552 family)